MLKMSLIAFEVDLVAFTIHHTFAFQQRQGDIGLTAVVAQKLLILMHLYLPFNRNHLYLLMKITHLQQLTEYLDLVILSQALTDLFHLKVDIHKHSEVFFEQNRNTVSTKK